MKRYFHFLLPIIFFACEKKEDPLEVPNSPGELKQTSVNMFPDYRDQVWFNFELGEEVYRNNKTEWDFVWQNEVLRLNTSRAMYAGVTNFSDLSLIDDTVGVLMRYDVTSGSPDSTAFNLWGEEDFVREGKVYFIDMGYDASGEHLGVVKMTVEVFNNELSIHWGDWKEEVNFQTLSIAKENDAKVYFSLDSGIQRDMPESEEWDMVFTQYVHVFYEETPVLPYLVTGVLTNADRVEVAEIDTNNIFRDLKLADAQGQVFVSDIDVIGYDWKDYSFDSRGFTVNPKKMYLVKVDNEIIYCLRFLDFYNSQGEKGNPLFQFKRL